MTGTALHAHRTWTLKLGGAWVVLLMTTLLN
jgi:hypothetical protein